MPISYSELTGQAQGEAPAPTKGTFSYADLTPQKVEPPTVAGFLADTAEWAQFGKTLLGTAAQVSDLGTSVVGGVLSMAPYIGVRVQAALQGESAKIGAQAATEAGNAVLPEELQTPWAKVAEHLGPDAKKAYEENPIAWIMGKMSKGVEKLGQQVETKEGLQAEDIQQLFKFTMSALGWGGTKAGVRKAVDARLGNLDVRGNPFVPEVSPEPGAISRFLNKDVLDLTGKKQAAKTQAAEKARAAREVPPEEEPLPEGEQPYRQPVIPEPLTAEEQAAKTKERAKDVKAAVKEETPAEKAARTGGAPVEGTATWEVNGTEYPVNVTGPKVKGPDGKWYTPVTYEGNEAHVPSEQLKAAKIDLPLEEGGKTPLDLNVEDKTAPPTEGELAHQEMLHRAKWEAEKARRVMEEDLAQRRLEAPLTPEEALDLKLNPRGQAKGARRDRWGNAGEADPELLAKIAAAGGVAAYLAANPDQAGEVAAIGAVGATAIVGKGKFKGMPESALVDAVRKGGAEGNEAFAHIVEQTDRRLDRVLNSFFRGREAMATVDDIKQDAYTKLFQAMKKDPDAPGAFRGESSINTFLHSIAVRKALNAQRLENYRPKTELTPEMEETAILANSDTPQTRALHQEMATAMERAIERLPDNFREPFWMAEVEGLPYQEIADRLGQPIGTVRSQISRAKDALQKMLKEYSVDSKTLGGMAALGGAATLAGYLDNDSPETLVLAAGLFVPAHLGKSNLTTSSLKAFMQGEAAGMNRTALWKSTGILRSPDGTLLRELPDMRRGLENVAPNPFNKNLVVIPTGKTLGDIFDHPKLYALYPWMRGIKVEPQPIEVAAKGSWLRGRNTIRLKGGTYDDVNSVIHHELAHVVQDHEYMAEGGSVQQFLPPGFAADRTSVNKAIKSYQAHAEASKGRVSWPDLEDAFGTEMQGKPLNRYHQEQLAGAERHFGPAVLEGYKAAVAEKVQLDKAYEAAYEQYRRLGGEVQARAVQNRLFMTQAELRDTPPWLDLEQGKPKPRGYDVAEAEWDNRSGGKAMPKSAEEMPGGEAEPRGLPQAGLGGKQGGAFTTRQMATVAAMAVGAGVGAQLNKEHPFQGAFYGAGVALLLASAKPKDWLAGWERAQVTGPLRSITELVSNVAYQKKVAQRVVMQLATKITNEVPDVARREAVYKYLENEEPVKLSPEELKVAGDVRAFYEGMGAAAKKAGVIREVLQDYATRIYGKDAKGLFEGKQIGGDTTLSSPFGKNRGYKTRAEAEAAGYTPVTLDIARVIEMYSDSINSAIQNKHFIDTLRDSQGEYAGLITAAKNAPAGYQFIAHPQMRGFLAHPDIAADLRFVFDAKNTGAIIAGLEAINSTQKRLGVTMSLFHASALEQALIGGVSIMKSPVLGVKAFGQSFMPMIFGESLAVKMIREGGVGDMVDRGMKAGLEVSIERQKEAVTTEDAQQSIYRGMDAATKFLDAQVPGLGKYTVGVATAANHMFDRAMWGRFHATLKIETFANKVSELSRNNARDVEAGRGQLKSQAEIDRMAASFTNDLYGGLNWYGIVSEMNSRWGRELASAALGPTGRLGMRMLMFAPDWTISTTRAAAKAFGPRGLMAGAGAVAGMQMNPNAEHGKLIGGILGGLAGYGASRVAGMEKTGSGVRGLIHPTELADLHRQYLLRSAFIYTTIVDGLNYQMSGHHLWENKDPTRLDLGDGRTMMASKHFMEPFHWLIDPKKQAMGKASFLVKESMSQLGDVEYWSPKGAPRMGGVERGQDISMPTRLGHAARQFVPISAQGFEQSNPQSAVASALGFGIYGKTHEERAAMKEEAKRKSIQRRIDKRTEEANK